MPNWCNNYVVLSHEVPSQITRVREAAADDKFFQEFVPCPEELQITCSPGTQDTDLQSIYTANVEKFGFPTWYEWCVANWGTKWDVSGIEVCDRSDNQIALFFDTAWSPPIEFYNALLELGFKVDAMYNEYGMCFCGHYVDGIDNCVEYSGNGDDIPGEIDECFGISEWLEECNSDLDDE